MWETRRVFQGLRDQPAMSTLAVNNIIFFRVAWRSRYDIMTVRRTGHQADIALPITSEMEAFFAIFASWRVTTSLYAFFLLLVAVLKFADKVPNLWLFGFLTLIANIEGIRRSMLNHGPGVRRMLKQYVDWAYRRGNVRSARSKVRKFHELFREHRGQHFALSYLPSTGRYVVEVYDPREREAAQQELDAFLLQHGVQQAWLPIEVRPEERAIEHMYVITQVDPS